MSTYIGYAITMLIGYWLFQQFILAPSSQQTSEITYSAFKEKLTSGQIVTVVIGDRSLTGTMQNFEVTTPPSMATGTLTNTVPFNTIFSAGEDPKLVEDLQMADVEFSFRPAANPIGGLVLAYGLPILLIGGFWFVISRQMSKGGAGGGLGGIFNVGKSKATEVKPETIGVTYQTEHRFLHPMRAIPYATRHKLVRV